MNTLTNAPKGHGGLLFPLDMFRPTVLAAVIGELLLGKVRNILDATIEIARHPTSPLALARIHGVTTLFVLTEPKLVANLSRLGVRARSIGGEVQHRGTRVPSMMSLDEIIGNMNFLVRAIFEVISSEVALGMEQAGRHT